MVVIFRSVILKRFRLVIGTKNICMKIVLQTDCWNHDEFDKLINDAYAVATGFPGKGRGTQIQKQRHSTFSNLFLCVKLGEAVGESASPHHPCHTRL